jgi:hypothetical protein
VFGWWCYSVFFFQKDPFKGTISRKSNQRSNKNQTPARGITNSIMTLNPPSQQKSHHKKIDTACHCQPTMATGYYHLLIATTTESLLMLLPTLSSWGTQNIFPSASAKSSSDPLYCLFPSIYRVHHNLADSSRLRSPLSGVSDSPSEGPYTPANFVAYSSLQCLWNWQRISRDCWLVIGLVLFWQGIHFLVVGKLEYKTINLKLPFPWPIPAKNTSELPFLTKFYFE